MIDPLAEERKGSTVRDLVLSGTPIDGEAGVGCRLRPDYDLPPLMFDREEIQAAGARRAHRAPLRRRAAGARERVDPGEGWRRCCPSGCSRCSPTRRSSCPRCRTARARRRRSRPAATPSSPGARCGWRTKTSAARRPNGRSALWACSSGAGPWTLAAWCELRDDFRDFRLDRVKRIELLDEPFADEPGRTLRDLLARYGPEAMNLLSE